MTYIGAVPTTGDFKKLDSITTSSATTFNLRQGGVAVYPQSANHCIVSLNGVIQAPIDAFTIVNDTIVFSSSLAGTDVINFILVLGNVNDIGVPSSDSVGSSELKSNAVTTAKITDGNVTAAKFNADVISGQTELATTPADTDEFIISDSGVLKRIDYSHIKSTSGVTKLADVTITDGDASEQINGCFSDTYESYLIQLLGAGVNAEASILIQGVYSTDTVISSGYYKIARGYNEDQAAGTDSGSNSSDGEIFGTSLLANEWNFANIWYHRPLGVGSFKTRLFGNCSHIRHTGSKLHAGYFGIGIDNTNKLTGLKFSTSTSTYKHGQVIVWGYST
mgnify:CR=1 FL=1